MGLLEVHTRKAAFEAVSAPEQNCSYPLLKVDHFVSDRFLKRSESSLNNFIRAEIAMELVLVNDLFKQRGGVANCMTDMAFVHTGNATEQFLHRNGTVSLISHCTGATFELEQKPVRYSMNKA